MTAKKNTSRVTPKKEVVDEIDEQMKEKVFKEMLDDYGYLTVTQFCDAAEHLRLNEVEGGGMFQRSNMNIFLMKYYAQQVKLDPEYSLENLDKVTMETLFTWAKDFASAKDSK